MVVLGCGTLLECCCDKSFMFGRVAAEYDGVTVLRVTEDVNIADPKLKDNEFYETHIIVKDRHVTIKLNGRTVVDYTEPKGKEAFSKDFERRLGEGTFALQCHDQKSIVHFKNIRVKRLD